MNQPGHPLVGTRALPVNALTGYPFIVREPGSGTRNAMGGCSMSRARR